MGRSYKNAKKLEQVAEEFSWGKGSVYCPELVELLEEDKELQADLRYLLGAGRIRTCYSVYGKAVDQTEIEESRLFTDIENWEASSRKQSDEDRSDQQRILDSLAAAGVEERVHIPVHILRQLYPLLDNAKWKITVSLAWNGENWEMVEIEEGDTTAQHYGLAVDLGSKPTISTA